MKINILFLVRKTKLNRKGMCPIRCRVTYNKERCHFATGQYITPSNWKSKQQYVEPPEPDAELINTQLSLIKTKLSQAFLFLQVKGSDFTVDDMYKQYKGEAPKKEFGVMEVYNLYSARIKKLIGIVIQLESGGHLQAFIKHKYKRKDIKIMALFFE